MRFRKGPVDEVSLDITPLIDVVFLLLIFFMVSTSFTRETQLSVELPEANGSPAQKEGRLIEVSVDERGHFFVNSQGLVNSQADTLRQALVKESAGQFDQPFVISADKETPYQAVVTVMDIAGELGFSQITMATRQPGQ